MRRVAGYHDIRMDGMYDLVTRARGASVLDVGCNRGLVGFEFANNGASLVHGCDNYEDGIKTARQLFADLRNVENKFEVVDLTAGSAALAPFGERVYDIVICLATIHKLARIMPADDLAGLIGHLGKHCRLFAWRGTSDKYEQTHEEMEMIDRVMAGIDADRIHTSTLSDLGLCAIWRRND